MLSRSDLIGQFILCRCEEHVPERWEVRTRGSWCLGHHRSLPVWEILGTGGQAIGWLLGYPITADGVLLEDTSLPVTVPFAAVTGLAEEFEAWLYQHGGRFAAVLLCADCERFYLDPFGSLATVYCPEQRVVASTPSAIPLLREDDYDRDLLRELGIPHEHTCWCPFGLTSRRSVERLLPAHCLDLRTWGAKRHWPKGDIQESRDPSSDALEAAALIRKNIGAIANRYPLHMSLTAGHDSRMLLACARDYLDRVQFFTMAVPTPQGKLDCDIAPRLARRLGLNHRILPYLPASEEEMSDWQYRVGDCLGGLRGWLVRTRSLLDTGRPQLMGIGGELARGFHWRNGLDADGRITVADLLEYRRIPPVARHRKDLRQRAEAWLGNLPVARRETVWDLLYHEEFHGCEAVGQFYGFVDNPFILLPFCRRRVVEIMMSLPRDYRQHRQMWADVLGSLWPELLELPFNWPVGVHKCMFFLRRRALALGRRCASLFRSAETSGRDS